MVYTLHFFSLQNAVCFIILAYLVPVLFTFYIQGVLKLKNNSCAKRLNKIQVILPLLMGTFTFNSDIWGNVMKTLTNSFVNLWPRQITEITNTHTNMYHDAPCPGRQFYCTAVNTPRFATYSGGRTVI